MTNKEFSEFASEMLKGAQKMADDLAAALEKDIREQERRADDSFGRMKNDGGCTFSAEQELGALKEKLKKCSEDIERAVNSSMHHADSAFSDLESVSKKIGAAAREYEELLEKDAQNVSQAVHGELKKLSPVIEQLVRDLSEAIDKIGEELNK